MGRRFSQSVLIEWFMLAAILLVAAFLRLGSPQIVEFKRDEAALSLLSLDVARDGDFPLLGIGSSVGVPNAPANVYLLAVPYVFSTNPAIATQFVGLLNVLAIAVTYGFARRYVGPVPALIAVGLFAVSPWAVIFSRKIWAQNMLPLFVVLVVLTGILGFIERKRWAQVAHLPLLVITGQIHYAAFVVVPVSALLIWRGRQHLSRAFVIGGVLALLLTLPYAAGMLRAGALVALNGASSTADTDELALTAQALRGAAVLIAGTEIHSLAGPERFEDYLARVPAVYPLFVVLAGMVVLSAGWLLLRAIRLRDARTPVDVALLVWLAFPIVAFSLTWTPFYIHYLTPVFPAAFVIVAFAGHDLSRSATSYARLVFGSVVMLVVVIGVLQVSLWLALLDFVETEHTPDGFGTPLSYSLPIRQAVLNGEARQVIGDVGGLSIAFDEEPAVWAALLYDMPLVRFEDHRTRVYPVETTQTLSNDCAAAGTRFDLREDEGCYVLNTREPDDLDLGALRAAPPARFDNGVNLLAYGWDASCLTLVWEITATTDADYNFAVHFVDAAGDRVAQADALSWPGVYWRPGDRVVREFCLAQQNLDIVGVDIGMYIHDGENFFPANLLDEMGAPVGQSVRLSFD